MEKVRGDEPLTPLTLPVSRRALVVSQVTLAVVLLVGAGLLFRSFLQLQQVNPGFDPENALTAHIQLPLEFVDRDWPTAVAFFAQLQERLESLPHLVAHLVGRRFDSLYCSQHPGRHAGRKHPGPV